MSARASESELEEHVSRPTPGVLESLRGIDGRVLVLGAGGKMGLHLALMLRRGFEGLKKSHRVIAVSRFGDRGKRGPFTQHGIETWPGDLSDPAVVENLPEAETVFFLAGQKFGTGDKPELLHRFNQEMPARIAERFKHARIVALSTGCVYPFVTPASGGSKEEDPVDPVGDYARSCLGREQAFLAGSQRHGTRLSLVRLNYAVDLRYGVPVDIALKVRAGKAVDVRMGWFNCIWQGDAIAHIVQSLSTPGILNVTGARILSVRDTAEWFGERFGLPAVFKGQEAKTAWLSDAGKSHRLFGLPEISEEELLDWVARWIERGGPLLGKATQFEVRHGTY